MLPQVVPQGPSQDTYHDQRRRVAVARHKLGDDEGMVVQRREEGAQREGGHHGAVLSCESLLVNDARLRQTTRTSISCPGTSSDAGCFAGTLTRSPVAIDFAKGGSLQRGGAAAARQTRRPEIRASPQLPNPLMRRHPSAA